MPKLVTYFSVYIVQNHLPAIFWKILSYERKFFVKLKCSNNYMSPSGVAVDSSNCQYILKMEKVVLFRKIACHSLFWLKSGHSLGIKKYEMKNEKNSIIYEMKNKQTARVFGTFLLGHFIKHHNF